MTRSSVLVPLLLALVGAAACEDRAGGGPPRVAMTPAAHDVHFPIASGKHAEVSCTECHGDSGSFKAFQCISCHEHEEPEMNATHAGFPDYAWDSQRCYACHKRGNVLDEIDHAVFPIRDDAKHAGVACASCHKNPADRSAVGCTTCHEHELLPMQGIHAGIPDYEWASASCVSCHPGAKPIGDALHPFFPTAAGTQHEGVSCAECHSTREDRSQLSCTSCHEQGETDPPHAGVPDYLYESSSCFLCHPGAEVPGTLTHTFFPIEAGDAHEPVSCAECHVNPDTRADVGCTTCHENHGQTEMATVHQAIPDYAFDSPACLFCHPNGEPTGQIDHEPMFPIAPPAAHDALSCRDCHTNDADRAAVGCISCHDHEEPAMAQTHGELPGYQWDSPSCLACHPQGQATGAVDHSFFAIGADSQHDGIACATCHVDNNDRSVVGCTSCHDHDAAPMFAIHKGMPDYQWQSSACVTCHPSGQPEGLMDHTSFFPIQTGDEHGDVSCAECHATREDRTQLSCAACHEQAETDPPHQGVPNYLFASSSCFMCHPNAENPGALQHSFFPIDPPAVHDGISCADCHTNPATRAEVGCASCHAAGDTDPIHTGVPGYEHSSPACVLCHPNAEPTGALDHSGYFPIEAPAAHADVSCQECHTNPATRTEVGCASCHAAGDTDPIHTGVPGYEHSSPACLGCHPQSNTPGSMDHSALFPIQTGDTHGGISCAECHASQTDRSQLSCTACHEETETGGHHSLVAGYVWESSSCVACHPQGEAFGAFDHVAFFPIQTGDTHGDIACAECHLDADDTSVLGCAQCHDATETNPIHNAVPGYEHSSPACLTCHPYGEADGLSAVDHTPYFPIGFDTKHDGVGCGDCHLDGNDLSVNGCAECHEQSDDIPAIHSNVGEFKDVTSRPSSDCKMCHADSQVHSVQTHGPFVINDGPHRRRECLRCHTETRTDKLWAADFKAFSCAACHSQNKMDDKHSGENGYAYDFPTCLTCHPDGRHD